MERLTAQDMSSLWSDRLGWPQDIGALAILDATALTDADGGVRIDAVRREIDARLHLAPRFRQVVHVPPRGLGPPLWVDAPRFDINDHVGIEQVRAPGDEEQLLQVIERLRRRPLDRGRPLWRMWLLPGLAGHRIGVFIKAHHAIADGMAGVVLLTKLLGEPAAPAPAWRPAPPPSGLELVADNVSRRVAGLRRFWSAAARPARLARRLRRLGPWVREVFGQRPVPRTSFNRTIGPNRVSLLIRCDLATLRSAAHAHGATVNDVLLAAVTGGLRDLLRGRGDQVDGVVLRAVVPVALHKNPGQAKGNLDGAMFVPLPVGTADPVRGLEQIAEQTTDRKRHHRPSGDVALRSPLIQRAFARHMARQRWVNAYVANVPGPHDRLSLDGAPVLELFPVVPLIGNVSLGAGALSYAGQFNITVVADLDICPDAGVLAGGIRRVLHSLAVPDRHRTGGVADAHGEHLERPGGTG